MAWSNNSTHNVTEYQIDMTLKERFLIVNVIVFLLIIFINLFIFYLFLHKRSLIRTPSNRLLLSLSVCDFTSGVVLLLRIIISIIPDEDKVYPYFIKYRILTDILGTFLVQTAVMHLCGITLDRFISIFYALRYKAIVTLASLKKYIVFAWIFSFATSVIQLTWLFGYFVGDNVPDDPTQIDQIETWYSIVVFIIFLFIPLILLGIAFILMFMEIRKIIFRPQPSVRKKKLSNIYSKQRKVLYTFSLMYLFFAMLAMPYFTLRFLIDLNNWMSFLQLSDFVGKLAEVLKSSISFINPILYMTTNREFKLAINSIASRSNKKFRYNIKRLSLTYNTSGPRRSFFTSSVNDDSGVYGSAEFNYATSYNSNNNNSLIIPSNQLTCLRSYKKINNDVIDDSSNELLTMEQTEF